MQLINANVPIRVMSQVEPVLRTMKFFDALLPRTKRGGSLDSLLGPRIEKMSVAHSEDERNFLLRGNTR